MEKTHSLNNNTISLVGNGKNTTIQHSNKRPGMNRSSLQQIDTNQRRNSFKNDNDELIMAQHDAQKTNTKTVSSPIDNHEINLSNQSNGKKNFHQHENCSPHLQSSSIEPMNRSSQALVHSNDANSSIDHIRSMLRNHGIGQIYKNYDFQYNCIDSLVETLKDKESSALVLLTKKVKSIFKNCLPPLNDNFHPLFLFDKDVNVYFEFTISDPKSLFNANERLPCSDWRILRHSRLIYSFVYEYCKTISE
ncbi:dead box atp-dependent rna helicase i-like protein [Dermatophagoides farinae]|nr:dead box atp-dependent rna helicase i-like protein [Dermatophagoides farinae]